MSIPKTHAKASFALGLEEEITTVTEYLKDFVPSSQMPGPVRSAWRLRSWRKSFDKHSSAM